MKKIDWYILRKYLTTFFFSISLFLVITVVFDTAEKIDDYIENEVPFGVVVVDYYLNFLPYFGVVFCPLFTFIAVIFFTSKMASNSEIIAILSSGTSFYRMLVPFFIGALIVGGLDYYASHWVVPIANRRMLEFERTWTHPTVYNADRNIHLQLNDSTYAYIENYSVKDSTGYKFALEQFSGTNLISKMRSRKIKWNNTKSKWEVLQYTIRNNDGMYEFLEDGARLDTTLNFTPADFDRKLDIITAMNSDELRGFIQQELDKGVEKVDFYYIELYKRTSFPFATIVLTLIGVSLASHKVRGGRGLHLALGIVIGFSYILFMQFSTTLSTNANLSPLLGVWIPNIVFSLLGLLLLKLAPK